MRSWLKYFGLWEYVDQTRQVPALGTNPTVAQINQHDEETMKNEKVVMCQYSALADDVFY